MTQFLGVWALFAYASRHYSNDNALTMSHDKTHTFRPPLYHGQRAGAQKGTDDESSIAEQKGWDAYRKWLSRVSARPPRERSSFDQSIYSWKGYNNWADRVKQSWKPDDTET